MNTNFEVSCDLQTWLAWQEQTKNEFYLSLVKKPQGLTITLKNGKVSMVKKNYYE